MPAANRAGFGGFPCAWAACSMAVGWKGLQQDEMRASKARIWLHRPRCLRFFGYPVHIRPSGERGQSGVACVAVYFWRQILDNVSGIQRFMQPEKSRIFPLPQIMWSMPRRSQASCRHSGRSLAGRGGPGRKSIRARVRYFAQGCDNVQKPSGCLRAPGLFGRFLARTAQ